MKQVFNKSINGAKIIIAQTKVGFEGVIYSTATEKIVRESEDFETLKASLLNEAGRLHPKYIGIEGAVERFLDFFQLGFADPAYFEWERNYKEQVRAKLTDILPIESALNASPKDAIEVRKVFGTNLLSQYENARVHQLLGSEHGASFVSSAANFAMSDRGDAAALKAMENAVSNFGTASWTILTYLPYFWNPENHMFLKPNATIDFAERVGDKFALEYSSDRNIDVYNSLQNLAHETGKSISSLKPEDRIDIQSFIWVVGAYTEVDGQKIQDWKLKNSND